MRNAQIYKASLVRRSNGVSANLDKKLQKKYNRRSIRIVEGDSVVVRRGEYAKVDGKIEKVITSTGRVSVAGNKKEKAKGDKFDVMFHASNLLVTGLNLKDPRRRQKIGATHEDEIADDSVTGVLSPEKVGGESVSLSTRTPQTDPSIEFIDDKSTAATSSSNDNDGELDFGINEDTLDGDENAQKDPKRDQGDTDMISDNNVNEGGYSNGDDGSGGDSNGGDNYDGSHDDDDDDDDDEHSNDHNNNDSANNDQNKDTTNPNTTQADNNTNTDRSTS